MTMMAVSTECGLTRDILLMTMAVIVLLTVVAAQPDYERGGSQKNYTAYGVFKEPPPSNNSSLKSDLFIRDYVDKTNGPVYTENIRNTGVRPKQNHRWLHFDQQDRFAVTVRVSSEESVKEVVRVIVEHDGAKLGTFLTSIDAFVGVTLLELLERHEQGNIH